MTLLTMSLQGGVLVGAAALLRLCARNRLPTRTFLAFWTAALLRLLLPFRLTAPWSPYRLLTAAVPLFAAEAVSQPGAISSAAVLPALPLPLPEISAADPGLPIWTLLWLLGALATACWLGCRYWRGRRLLREALPVQRREALALWQTAHPLRRPLRLLQSDRLGSPLAAGLLRPRIYLPRVVAEGDAETLRFVLTHEYLHIRRMDGLRKLAALLALCVHWFNPLVWLLVCLLDRDLERLCDEAVLRRCRGDCRAVYARSLLRLAEKRTRLPAVPGFAGNSMKERIVSIMKFKKKPIFLALPAVLAAAALSLFLTTLPSKAAAKEPEAPATTLNEMEQEKERIAQEKAKMQAAGVDVRYSWHDMPEEYQKSYLESYIAEEEYVSENGTPYKLKICSARWAVENGYPVNERGETYAPNFWFGPEDEDELAHLGEPDLELAGNPEGVVGYIRMGEYLAAAEGREVHMPEEAAAWMADPKSREPRQIPLYLEDGLTIVGYFTIGR